MAFLSKTDDDPFSFLPDALRQELALFCQVNKEAAVDVIADALALHLDEMAGDVGLHIALEEPALEEPVREAAP